MIGLSVVDEFGELEKDFGHIPNASSKAIIEAAKKRDMLCLSFISLDSETRFNGPQCYEIKKEIDQLKKDPSLDQALLDTLEQARQVALSDVHLFLKFSPEIDN